MDGLMRGAEKIRVETAQACGLNLPCYNLLSLAEQRDQEGITVSEAASHLEIRPQALSGAAGELVNLGYLARKVDDGDGRARRLTVTSKGREALAPAREKREALLQQILSKVPSPSVARLVLQKLHEALSQEREVAVPEIAL
ncbi:MAG: MarR family transcriptional regulator [Deltaproteobacteria bacterium]|nr:MarR family transcriptional regulator [Deltaproteobacteria bacterium]